MSERSLTKAESDIYDILTKERQCLDCTVRLMTSMKELSEKLPHGNMATHFGSERAQGVTESLCQAQYESVLDCALWCQRCCGIVINVLCDYGDCGGDEFSELRGKMTAKFNAIRENPTADLWDYSLALREIAKEVWVPDTGAFSPVRAFTIELIRIADLVYPDFFEDTGAGFSGEMAMELPF